MSTTWQRFAIKQIKADENRSTDTNLLRIWFERIKDIDLYLKDESNHKTGSLKHRLARNLYLNSIMNHYIDDNTTIVEASSGNTAISEAYFAQLLGLKYIAVMSNKTAITKINRIRQLGGKCVLIDPSEDDRTIAKQLARDKNGSFIDQFSNAERVQFLTTKNSIAGSIYQQMSMERYPIPKWIVCGVGTGGTATAIGRYINYMGYDTALCAVDPEFSAYYEYYKTRDHDVFVEQASRIEGIGRHKAEKSFIPTVVSRMLKIPDAASIASIHFLNKLTGLCPGGSSGTNFYGCLQLINEMKNNGKVGSIVSIICDSGHLYESTYYNEAWLKEQGIDIAPYLNQIQTFYDTGRWISID